ncbi:MAG TPA: AMP-binding protein [Streptosporangiaceae bacterium]|jgi:acyl-CoA synthetase (AMP-forming)/AMP-acid ligase II|nr:AMP-binding protein [Streptosporangiaceae bacterium]
MDGPVRSLTWPELDDQVARLAQVLLDEGIGAGDVVGIQLPNTVEIVIAVQAARAARAAGRTAPQPAGQDTQT